jgi:hypothetical protein
LLGPRKEKSVAKKQRSTSQRELIDTGRTKMFGKRSTRGRFKEMDEVSRSLGTDRRKKAKRKTASGHGDQGDRTARTSTARKSTARKSTARKTARKTTRKAARKKSR